jgi:adenosine tuberculosinyltransferase
LDRTLFLALPDDQLAEIVRRSGVKVCVFPINGTRRWYLLEHAAMAAGADPVIAYMDITGKRHLEIYKMFFDHGVDTLLTPVFGPDLLERGDVYIERVGADGLARLAEHPDFVRFYDEYQVRVRFYGDFHQYLASTPYAGLCDKFDSISKRTTSYERHRLFFGVFANDSTESIANMAIRYYQEYGNPPKKSDLIEMYYGEAITPVDFFIGFDKLSSFDMPLVATGSEDLYFTTAPSPYISSLHLRNILYDHIFIRKTEEQDYSALSPEDFQWMQEFYRLNQNKTMGIGALRGGIWFPLPSVEWPE